jgi:RNA polymerase sigma-70 factor (ECF subfamily)
MNSSFAQDLIALLPRLRGFARSLTGKAEEADDLVQAACERALRAQASWEPGTRLDAWLFKIIKNLWIDQIRRRRREGATMPLEDAPEIEGMDGRRLVETRLTLAKVEQVMASLTREHREVLQLVCVEELGYAEAAQRLNVPVGTVMSRLSRARLALASRLETPDEQSKKPVNTTIP